jgi:hypothetical protein
MDSGNSDDYGKAVVSKVDLGNNSVCTLLRIADTETAKEKLRTLWYRAVFAVHIAQAG